MKKLFYLFVLMVLFIVPFSSCSDDDEDKVLIPEDVVTNLSFTDSDYEEGKIGGKVSWNLPASEELVTGYVIYLSDSENSKGEKLDEVAKGVKEYTIEKGTDFKSYLHVIAKNSAGESDKKATTQVRDNTSPVVSNLSFTDADRGYKKIGGLISWNTPEAEEFLITGYAIYLSDSNVEKGEKIGTIIGIETGFEIPMDTDYKPYIQVAIISGDKEADDFAVIGVTDEYDLSTTGFYILNRGNFNSSNSSLGYYNLVTHDYTADLFLKTNGKGMGSSPEDMVIYGSKIYIPVYESNVIMITDLDGKLIKEIQLEGDETVNPRCATAGGGKVYISYYKAHSVARLDTISLEIERVTPVGRYPEHLAVSGNKLFVANSGGLDYSNELGYDKTVTVIDLSSFTEIEKIEVAMNPGEVGVNSKGEIYVISLGDHGSTVNQTLQRINPDTYEVTEIGYASRMSMANDKIYVLFNQYYGTMDKGFFVYDALTGSQLNSEQIITDGTVINNPSSIDVDPKTGEIYIGTYDYASTSDLYMFSPEGKLQRKLDTKGYDIRGIWFNTITEE